MGFSRLGLALGGAIGYSGGWLYDVGNRLEIPQRPWFMLGLIGFYYLAGVVPSISAAPH